MQVDIKDTSSVEKKITVRLDKSSVEKEYDVFLNTAKKSATVPGFRQGQAPIDVLRKHFAAQLKKEVSGRLVHSSLLEVMRDYNLPIVGNPVLTEDFRENALRKFVGRFNLDGTFLFEVDAEVQPVLESLNYDNLEIKTAMPVVADLVEKQILELQQQFCSPEPVQRPAQLGDRVLVDFFGTVEGKEFGGGTQTLFSINIGTEVIMSGFCEQFVGRSDGDNFTFTLTLPSDWQDSAVAGKEAVFSCVVYSVSQLNLPEINDDFSKMSLHDTMDSLRNDLAKRITENELKAARSVMIEEITDTLLANNKFDVPKVWVENELKQLAVRLGIKSALSVAQINTLKELAIRSVRRSFLLDKIYEKEESIHLSTDEIQQLLNEEGLKYKLSAEEVLTQLKNMGKYEGFVAYHQQLKAIDFLFSKAQAEKSQ